MSEENGLPDSWRWARFGDVARVDSDLVNPADYRESPHIAPNHMESGTGRLLPYTSIGEDGMTSSKHRFRAGHIIYSKIRPYLAKAVLVDFPGLCSADCYPVSTSLEPSFLHRWLISPMFTAEVSGNQGRTLLPKINQDALIGLGVPVPPLAEQRRIVAKLDDLRGRSRRAREALDEVPALLDQLKQSVLAAAFRGDLTADWREKNPNVEPASVLLDRIRAERRRRWEQANPKKKYVEPEPVDPEGLPDLPEGWCWASLDEVASSFDYGTSAKSGEVGRVPVLRMGNLQGGEIDWTDLKYTDDEDEIRTYSLEPNTVLFNRTNSPALVGKTAIYRGERLAVFAGYLVRICLLSGMDPDFVNLHLNSIWARDWCWRVKSDGVSQSNISAGKLREYRITLCPEAEQAVIVDVVRACLSAVRNVTSEFEHAMSQVDSLDQAILAKAFRGELVPQDPNDEPADVLLARIKAEADPTKPSRGRRGRQPREAGP